MITRPMSRPKGSRTLHGPLAATLAAGAAVAGAASFLAARTYDAVTDDDGIETLDRPALALAMRLRNKPLDAAAAGIAYAFGPVGMPMVTLIAATTLSVRRHSPTPMIALVAAGGGSLAMTIRDKDFVRRNRPPRADAIPPYELSPSFPSGHTLNATTLTAVFAYLLATHQRRASSRALTYTAAGTVSVAVGLSRVLLGAHWLTDVIFGWTAGAAWASTVVTALRVFRRPGPAG